MAGVMALAVDDTRLHNKCVGCVKASWIVNYCIVITNPKEEWGKGKCRYRSEDPDWKQKMEEAQTQYQQSRCPGQEDLIGWLMETKPPSIREKEAILPMPAPAAKGGGSKSGRKRGKKPTFRTLYLEC